MKTETKKSVPAYTTYTSFTNFINDLRENGMPSHITRSVVKGSNSAKSSMMASLKALELIDAEENPSRTLTQLVDNEDNYSEILENLLREKYWFLFDETIDIETTTTEKVKEKFQEQGASGSTVSKCISFFLAAAKAANITVSARVKPPPVLRSTVKRNKRKHSNETPETPDGNLDDDQIPEGMERITVPLRGMADGIIYFPAELDEDDAKRALKMTKFILEQFYGIDDE